MLENYAIDPDSEFACRSAFAVNFCFEAFRQFTMPNARMKFQGEIYHQYLQFFML